MTTIDPRPGAAALDLTADRFADLTAEIQRLRDALAERDRAIGELTEELRTTRLGLDDLLDRESMHVYDPDMERLTTAAEIDRRGAPRAQHNSAGPARSLARLMTRAFPPPPPRTLPAPAAPQTPEIEDTGAWLPGIEWEGFDR
ncbi:hypothetical protein [Nocardia sp. CC227C]|uniref:hypothetical protein n=1 Tax=Nocardia sp. CC227C TaxID=3044562 RepID=UPI00278BDADB|nr:hypothetical protein [Nocardia sp. CC227C]